MERHNPGRQASLFAAQVLLFAAACATAVLLQFPQLFSVSPLPGVSSCSVISGNARIFVPCPMMLFFVSPLVWAALFAVIGAIVGNIREGREPLQFRAAGPPGNTPRPR